MMSFNDLPAPWKRVFELEWQSLCEGSKAIAAVITDPEGRIVSEGRNGTAEHNVPNPRTAHAETEAVRAFDLSSGADIKKCTLYAGLEPCVMCMGTLVMGGIRRVVIGARDDFGGAMKLIPLFDFARNKGIEIVWTDDGTGDIQRAMQTLRELLYNKDAQKLEEMLEDFSVHNRAGVEAAKALFSEGLFEERVPTDYTAAEVYDLLAEKIKKIKYTEDKNG